MKLSLYCIFLWAAFLPFCGKAAPFPIESSEADAYAASQRASWQSIWADLQVDARLAEAVVFPELVRYSCWQDEMEKSAVGNSYVALGTSGPDFSVGHFQMKASWVERLERRWMQCPLHRTLEIYFDTSDSRFARKARLSRLSDDSFWQPLYVGLYLRLLYIDYPELADLPMSEQVRLCATAYNNGASLPGPGKGNIERLYQWSSLSSFHTDLIATPLTQKYCYAELSLTHYLNR